MDALWIALGVVILVVTFLDTFLAVLNYDEGGILINRIVRWEWVGIRAFTRRVSRRWRPLVLRQVTGVLLLTTILGWIGGMVLGFTFIYLGLIGLGAFQIDKGVGPDFVGALYLSVGQFATVGADNISPGGGWVNLLPVAEALMSVVLLSFTITFLSNIYGAIQFLRSLCADFFQTGPGVGSPTEALRPYLPDGEPRDLDRHLNELVDDFNLYCDSLRQDHAAYLFQSGEEQFSLPFALYMTSGVVGALSWGLPTGHPATKSPSLVRIREVFDDFRARRYRMMRWRAPQTPDPVGIEQFRSVHAAFGAHTSREAMDPWVLRFLALDADMAEIIGSERSGDVDDAYRRYSAWLPFAYPAQQFVTLVSRDLDYQPIYHGDAPAEDASGPVAPAPPRRRGRAIAWLRRRVLFLDPGALRFRGAVRTLGAVVVAVAIAVTVSIVLQVDATAAGVFAALVAVAAVPLTAGGAVGRTRTAGLLALIPVALGIVAGAFVPREPVPTVIGLAVVAGLAVWLGRAGRRWALCGRMAFLAFYFALLLAVSPGELVVALVAAGIGVVCAWAVNLLPGPRRERLIRAAVDAVAQRVVVLLDAAIDALSGIGDRRTERLLRAENAALRNSVTSLTVLLDAGTSADAESDLTRATQLRAFDVQLAAGNLLRALPAEIDDALTVDVRSRLAGRLADLLKHVREVRTQERSGGSVARSLDTSTPEGIAAAMPAYAAIRELSDAVDELLVLPGSAATQNGTGTAGLPAPVAPVASVAPVEDAGVVRAARRATDRRAVQTGLATGLGLYLGSLVSPTHQLWAALPAYQALAEADGERIGRIVQRLVATVAGAAAGFGLALWTGHDGLVAFAVVAVSVFFMSALRTVASSWTAFWQTALLATLYDLLARLDAEAIHLRVLETAIGAVVALVVAAVILPTRTRARVMAGMSALVTTTAGVVHGALQRLADPSRADDASARRAFADAQSAMQHELDGVLQHAGSLQADPGALQHSGIQPQLTSLVALALYTRHLAAALAEPATHTITAAQWQQLDADTSDNFRSALAVLGGRLPASIRDPHGVGSALADGDPGDPAAVAVVRINETLLTFMAAVQPGSADPSPDPGRP